MSNIHSLRLLLPSLLTATVSSADLILGVVGGNGVDGVELYVFTLMAAMRTLPALVEVGVVGLGITGFVLT